ncbi:MAG: protein of unknown function containing DUF4168 domain [Phormidium sp. OSCR]|nr:MAG: protein of unknown function containing DUF4168 domain [Phormidium sp. OSCR]
MLHLRVLSKPLATAATISLLLLGGCGGNASNENAPVAEGENSPETSLNNYTAAVWEIERQRQATYRVLAENVPDSEQAALAEVRCNQPDTIRGFSRTLRREIVDYCDRVAEIIEAQNLTVDEFNQIGDRLDEDPLLETQVMQQLTELRQQQQG